MTAALQQRTADPGVQQQGSGVERRNRQYLTVSPEVLFGSEQTDRLGINEKREKCCYGLFGEGTVR